MCISLYRMKFVQKFELEHLKNILVNVIKFKKIE